MPIDEARSAQRVTEFIELVRAQERLGAQVTRGAFGGGPAPEQQYQAARSAVNALRPIVEAIAAAVQPDLLTEIAEGLDYVNHSAIGPCERLLGAISARKEIAELTGPQGPKLAAADMHRWVWDFASPAWAAGLPREAVRSAAIAIFSSHLPNMLQVSKDTAPEAQCAAFKTEPADPDHRRLRLQGFETDSEDYRNAHQGAQFLGLACAKLIRNLSAHSAEDQDEQEALEELAMLSRFARLVEASRLETE